MGGTDIPTACGVKDMSIERSKELANFVKQYLDSNTSDLGQSLEVIGNVLLQLGADYMDLPDNGGQVIGPAELIELILEDRRVNGETVANATALQGLTLLNWLGTK